MCTVIKLVKSFVCSLEMFEPVLPPPPSLSLSLCQSLSLFFFLSLRCNTLVVTLYVGCTGERNIVSTKLIPCLYVFNLVDYEEGRAGTLMTAFILIRFLPFHCLSLHRLFVRRLNKTLALKMFIVLFCLAKVGVLF